MSTIVENNENNETWLSNIRIILRRNQGLVNAFQYIAGTVAVFVPSHFRYSEIFSEGVYSLSRLVSLLNRTLLDGSLESLSGLEPLLRFITKGFATIEVLLEKISQSLMGPIQRYTAILIIESSKTLCRLMILVERRRPSMLIDWGKDDQNNPEDASSSSSSSSVLDLNHYESWYKVLFNFEIEEHYKEQNSSYRYSSRNGNFNGHHGHDNEPVFYTPLARIMARTTRTDSLNEFENVIGEDDAEVVPFVGKRSGMKLFVDLVGFQKKIEASSGKCDADIGNIDKDSDHFAIMSQSSIDTEEDDPNFKLGKSLEPLGSGSRSGSISGIMKYEDEDEFHDRNMNTTPRRHESSRRQVQALRRREGLKDPETPELAGGKASDNDSPDMGYNNYNTNDYQSINENETAALDQFGNFDAYRMAEVDSINNKVKNGNHEKKTISHVFGASSKNVDTNKNTMKDKNKNIDRKIHEGADYLESGLGRESSTSAATAKGIATPLSDAIDNENTTTFKDTNNTTIPTADQSTFSPETLLVLGEILHVTRPTVYAMIARHLLGQPWAGSTVARDPRFEAIETAARARMSSNDASSGTGSSAGGIDDHTNSTSTSDPDDGNPFEFSRYSTTTILRMKVFAVALLGSLIVEVSSVLATQKALTLTRERALKQILSTQGDHRNNNSSSDRRVPVLALSKIHLQTSSLRPHSFDKELRRRKLAILLYLIRTPLFDVATLPAMRAISRAIANVPLVGGIPDYIVGVVRYLNASHFYNSGSS